MIMNKFFTILLFMFFAAAQVKSQALIPISFEQKVGAATLIVEARVTKKQSFRNPAHTMIYTAWNLEVYKVFKGELPAAPVQVVTEGGIVDDEGVAVSELLKLQEGMTGVFFLYPNSIQLKAPDADARLLYDVYASAQGFLRYNFPGDGAYAPFAGYDNIAENLYPALRSIKDSHYQEVKALPEISKAAAKGTGTISDFTPLHVRAGAHLDPANNTLTINGTGFGTAAGSAGITFDDADDGPGGNFTALIPYNNSLITSWTNTQIIVKVPDNAGTGDFRIYDNTGALSATGNGLIVDYAVMTADFGTGDGFQEVNMMNTNGAGGYDLAYSTNTSGSGINMLTSPGFGAVQRALVTHRQTGGVNFSDSTGGVINTTTVQTINSSAPNIIEYDNANTGLAALPAGVLGVCRTYFGRCGNPGNAVRRTGFDIQLYNGAYTGNNTTAFTNGPCAPAEGGGTNQLDLETVIFHELGHASNQGHVIDDYQYTGGGYAAANPASVMHFNLLNGVRRNSYDNALLSGVQYAVTAKSVVFGGCTASTAMMPLSSIISARDECSGLFPAAIPINGKTINFDLVHATSNKSTDPQYTALRTTSSGTNVTNTQYYAFMTSPAGGTLNVNITGYTTVPATACTSGGVEMALYNVSSCPAGQSYPVPVAHRTFTGNGALAAFTGLAGNTSYLLVADGLENTKATFNSVFTSTTALPVGLIDFNGRTIAGQNVLNWRFSPGELPLSCTLERSIDGREFTGIYEQHTVVAAEGQYTDPAPFTGKNYYRLRMSDLGGTISYSRTIVMEQQGKDQMLLSPSPATTTANLYLNTGTTGPVTAVLFHSSGQKAAQWNWQARPGVNMFILDVASLAPGYYLLKVNTGERLEYLKLLKK